MNQGLGIGGLLILAVLYIVLKPLLIGLWQGVSGLFTRNIPKNRKNQ